MITISRIAAIPGPLMPAFVQEPTYGQWALLGVAVAAIAGFCKILHHVWSTEHRDVERARLSLEQVSSSFFVSLVLQEARRVFAIVDDHLPQALSQSGSPDIETSRFDNFCMSLRAIPQAELSDRGRYASIIKESFGQIISDRAGRLIEAMSSVGPVGSAGRTLNPTGARFSLEGDGFLKFVVVAEFDCLNRKMEARFQQLWGLTGLFAVLGILFALGVIGGVVIDHDRMRDLAIWCLPAGTIAFLFILLSYTLCYVVKRKFIRRAQDFGDPQAVLELVKEKRADA